MKTFHGLLLLSCSAVALTGCGPDDIASPGTGGVVINNPAPTPTATATSAPTTVTAAAAGSCPAGTLEQPTVASGPQGTWRVCRLPALIRTSMNLPKIAGLVYEINGRVNVGCDGGFEAPTAAAPRDASALTTGCPTNLTADDNVTLNISPGVILYGNTGSSFIAVNRGNKINAVGTAAQPIIFTARANITGFDLNNNAISDTTQQQWGGVILLGRGITGDCAVGTYSDTAAANTCERNTEGTSEIARYGGRDNAYNAGRMSYVSIRYSGFPLAANQELQSLTGEAIGTGTVLDHIHSHNSSDDGAEFFGGAPRMKYFVATGADDDSLDVDVGAQADFQWGLIIQRPANGDTLFEIDTNGLNDPPRTRVRIANYVALQPESSATNEGSSGRLASILLAANSDTEFYNTIIATPNNECIRMRGGLATVKFESVRLQCNSTKYIGDGGFTAAQVAGFVAAGSNNSDAYTPTLTSLFINGANENGVTAFTQTSLNTGGSSFFDTPTPNRIGAAWAENSTWYTQWTCNSSYANFGSSALACTTLPTT